MNLIIQCYSLLLLLPPILNSAPSDFAIPHSPLTKSSVDSFVSQLNPILKDIKHRKFFRIFKVSLGDQCPYWRHQMECSKPSCSVCECEESEIPALWKGEKSIFSQVTKETQSNFLSWVVSDEEWIVHSSEDSMSYVDLTRNPHGDTGYVGKAPLKIWNAIFKENCFISDKTNFKEKCLEEKVFHHLLSGLRGSISAHIAKKFHFDDGPAKPNLAHFEKSFKNHPERVKDVYFAFVFMMRAIAKASETLFGMEYLTGDSYEDLALKKLFARFEKLPIVQIFSGKSSFDERRMFEGNIFNPKIEQYKQRFRNISRIINCIHCERCQLYGKLQLLGLGTALKIFFSSRIDLSRCSSFKRNEVIALFQTLAEFAEAIEIINHFQ